MRQQPRIRTWLSFVILLLLVLLSVVPTRVLAMSQQIKGCLPDVGKRIPVILVHGFVSGPSVWGALTDKKSMIGMVSQIPGVYVEASTNPAIPPSAFDYYIAHTHWVDDAAIGPKLAQDIACMAESSREQGGPGKVIVVAHSMGGLATRYAAHVVLPDGHKVSDDIGLVVEIGTPNTGTSIADYASGMLRTICTFAVVGFAGHEIHNNSITCDQTLPAMWAMESNVNAKVNQLPKLPTSIPVMEIAGNATILESLGLIILPVQQNSDLVVPVNSATAEASNPAEGGGVYFVKCVTDIPLPAYTDGVCEHTHLPFNPVVKVQVVKSIVNYLNYLQQPCPVIAGTCIGVKYGDMDADRIPDKVGITYLPNDCQAGIASSCRIGIRVILDNGGIVDGSVPWNPPTSLVSLDFLGVSDIRGDGRSVVFLYATGGCSNCGTVYAYELKQGVLQPLAFSGGGGLAIDAAASGDGFTCQKVGNVHQVVSVVIGSYASGGFPGNYIANETTYQADTNGVMNVVGQKTVTLNQQQANAAVGAHCNGLSPF